MPIPFDICILVIVDWMCYPGQIYLLQKTISEDGDASTRGIILKCSVWRSWYVEGLYFRMCESFCPLSWQSPTAPTHTPTRFVFLSSFVVAWFGCQFFWSGFIIPPVFEGFPEDGESVRDCLSPGSDKAGNVLIPWLRPAIWGLFRSLFFLEFLY